MLDPRAQFQNSAFQEQVQAQVTIIIVTSGGNAIKLVFYVSKSAADFPSYGNIKVISKEIPLAA